MQVLVALALAKGEVLSRDDLIRRCWNGRVVGENAINRVISRLRHAATGFGAGSFRLETITKVGYRLVVDGSAPEEAPSPLQVPHARRRILAGAVAVAGAAALGFGAWRVSAPDAKRAEARELVRKGLELRSLHLPASSQQALDYFREATRIDPDYAEAWGLLAMAHRFTDAPGAADDPRSGRAKSLAAAKRALELKSDNPDAQAALVLAPAYFRNWAVLEAGCRSLLRRHPDHVATRLHLGQILGEVGRLGDSIEQLREVNRRDPFRPIAHYRLVQALWSAGREGEAEEAVDRAMERWPRHSAVWEAKFRLLAFSGRPASAAAFVRDAGARAAGYLTEEDVGERLAFTRALLTRASADVDAAVAPMLARLQRAPGEAAVHIPKLSALGRLDDAFAAAEGYFLARGRWILPLSADDHRASAFLFYPPSAPMRADPRFAGLTGEIGLEGYWRSTGAVPDYRR